MTGQECGDGQEYHEGQEHRDGTGASWRDSSVVTG